MKKTAIILAASLAVGAMAGGPFAQAREQPAAPRADVPAADNTKINERDRNRDTTLPTDQPNDRADLKLASDVRSAIEKDKSLSTMAHNVKLVAANGVVTLRGPVANAGEKSKITRLATNVAGVKRVDDQLDVKNQ